VEHHSRAAGRSKYRFLKLITLNFDLLTGYSILPIQIVSLGGIAIAAIGFILSLVSLVLFFLGGASSTWGWPLAFSLVFFLFGVQLAALGIMGEYIGRIHIEAKRRPFYLVRTILEREP
jgi:undecaprenyl-phosphate 4-deoxy-4-formamido-L-arabinose transferase